MRACVDKPMRYIAANAVKKLGGADTAQAERLLAPTVLLYAFGEIYDFRKSYLHFFNNSTLIHTDERWRYYADLGRCMSILSTELHNIRAV